MILTIHQIRTMQEKTLGYNKTTEVEVDEELDVDGNEMVRLSVYNVDYMIAPDGSWDSFSIATQEHLGKGRADE